MTLKDLLEHIPADENIVVLHELARVYKGVNHYAQYSMDKRYLSFYVRLVAMAFDGPTYPHFEIQISSPFMEQLFK